MQKSNHNKLDNPVWHSLAESHQAFAVDNGNVKFYHPDYCPFGGFTTIDDIKKHIDAYATMIDNFFVVGEQPELSYQLHINREIVCLQMIINNSITIPITEEIVLLTNEHAAALHQLVNLVQPGYFKQKTFLLGNYYGIFKNEELVAAAGERMTMYDFVEVSAIVTHPNHTGKGYAKQLTAHTVNNIFSKNKMPYLHVLESNSSAIQLYKKLGFTTRRKISFWQITK